MNKPSSASKEESGIQSPPSGRVPPYSKEAEAAVIGCILLNNQALNLVQEIVNKEDFYVEVHRRIFGAIQDLSLKGLPVDHVTLGNELLKAGDLEKIGGPMALDNLTTSVATVANVQHYIQDARAGQPQA